MNKYLKKKLQKKEKEVKKIVKQFVKINLLKKLNKTQDIKQ